MDVLRQCLLHFKCSGAFEAKERICISKVCCQHKTVCQGALGRASTHLGTHESFSLARLTCRLPLDVPQDKPEVEPRLDVQVTLLQDAPKLSC